MLKGVSTKEGFIYVEMTAEEIAALPKPVVIWHDDTRPIQIIIPEGVKTDLLLKKQEHDILANHPEVAMILDYVKNINAPTFNENGGLCIYLGELFDAHKLLLESFGIQITIKPNV